MNLNPQLRLKVEGGADLRHQNLPTADEVSMIVYGEYGSNGFRDIVLARRVNGNDLGRDLTLINPNHALYLPLHYVLLLPYGEHGWHWGRTLEEAQNNKLAQRALSRFRLHSRVDEPTTCFHAQKRFQQFVVDAWAVCNQNNC